MSSFSKNPSKMNLAEARAAYKEAIRNVDIIALMLIQRDPAEKANDSSHTAHCKQLFRRIRYLEEKTR